MNVLQISSSGAKLCDEHGDSAGIALAFSLGQHLTLEFDLRGDETDDGILVPLDAAKLADCTGFYFALSNVWNAASAPLFLRTSGITVETRNGKTILSVELPDTGVTSLISALAGKASAAFTCEIGGLDANALAVFVWQFQVTVCNRIYLGGDLPESISGDPAYLTAAEVRAMIGEGGVSSGGRIDFTALEVIANETTIPAGSTDVPDLVVDGVGPAVDIPAGMTHAMKFKTLGTDITIDWGDGNTVVKPSAELTPDGSWTAEHTYGAPGKYLVKIYGGFSRIQTVSGKNLVHRVLDFDLPIAKTHTNLQEFAKDALRLVAVNFNDQMMASHIGNLIRTFSGCKNLRKVEKMNRLAVVASCNGLFQDCVNMTACEFACPPVAALADDGGDGYRNVFQSATQDAQWALTCDLNTLFPSGGFAQEVVDLSNFFYHAGTRECYGNITLTAANAEKLAKKLWLSGKKFVGFSNLFLRLPASVRSRIPYAWGGTMAGIYIDTATGCAAKSSCKCTRYISAGGTSLPLPFNASGDTAEIPLGELDDASFSVKNLTAVNCAVSFIGSRQEGVDNISIYGGTFGFAGNVASGTNVFHNAVAFSDGNCIFGGVYDHCFLEGSFERGTFDITGGTAIAANVYNDSTFRLSDQASLVFPTDVPDITIVYTAGCTINGEVKTSGGTIVTD
ncbi:MAG: hypothetical protein MJ033_01530 [Victivallaceae bacterium]|nr:hypothetical protein [Victivallaceae bacterium]